MRGGTSSGMGCTEQPAPRVSARAANTFCQLLGRLVFPKEPLLRALKRSLKFSPRRRQRRQRPASADSNANTPHPSNSTHIQKRQIQAPTEKPVLFQPESCWVLAVG